MAVILQAEPQRLNAILNQAVFVAGKRTAEVWWASPQLDGSHSWERVRNICGKTATGFIWRRTSSGAGEMRSVGGRSKAIIKKILSVGSWCRSNDKLEQKNHFDILWLKLLKNNKT